MDARAGSNALAADRWSPSEAESSRAFGSLGVVEHSISVLNRRVKLACPLLVVLALGCSNDLDALFVHGSTGADSGSPLAKESKELPWMPALPDLDHRPDCEQCAKSSCAKARMDCLEDDDCIDELRCKGQCDNPACLLKCGADLFASTQSMGWSLWYADYANCVFGQCTSECNVGSNWDCQGRYDWSAAPVPRFDVIFNLEVTPTFFLGPMLKVSAVGDTVHACDDVQDCSSSEFDSARVGIDNKVALELTANAFPPQQFRGYLELEQASERKYSFPLAHAQEYFIGPTDSPPPAAETARPRIVAGLVDCLIARARDAAVTLPDFPDVEAWDLDFNRGEWFKSPHGFEFINLPDSAIEQRVLVRAVRPDMSLISERAIWLRPSATTSVVLAPAASSD